MTTLLLRTPPGPRGRRRTPARPRSSGLRTAPPSGAVATYTRALVAWDRETSRLLLEALAPHIEAPHADAADGSAGDVSATLISRMVKALETIAHGLHMAFADPLKLLDVVSARVETHTAGQWRAQLAKLGVKLSDDVVPGIANLRARWRTRNAELIRTLAHDKVARLRDVIEASPGSRVETLAKRIQEATGASRSHAELLARDQTLKLNAQVAQARHAAAGITEYFWRTSRDERVRSRHKDLEGTRHAYADPPVVDVKTGRRANAGEDYQCRCTADPILPGIDDV